MTKRFFFLAAVAALSMPLHAAITMSIQSGDSNNRLGGVYLGSSIYKPDAVGIYMTQGLKRYAWNGTNWYDDVSGNCYTDPTTLGNDARCGDQIGLFWKHVSCIGSPGNSYYPCASNEHWNAYSGSDNIPGALPQPYVWPRDSANNNSITGFNAVINYQSINAVFPAQTALQSGYESVCHAQNSFSRATGASSPHVTYDSGTGRYYMAFNGHVNHPDDQTAVQGHSTGADNWRVLWAVSTDGGSTWTISPNFLLKTPEQTCDTGFGAADLFIDGGYFYLYVSKILGTGESYGATYLLRTPITTSQFGYMAGTWKLAGPKDPMTGKFTWSTTNFDGASNWGAKDLGAMGVAIGDATPYYGEQLLTVQRVFNSAAPNSASKYIAVQTAGPPTSPALNVYSSPALDEPFTLESQISLAGYTPGTSSGYCPAFTRYQDNTPSTPRAIGSGLDLWLTVYESATATNVTKRFTVKLTGDIFP